MKKITFTLLFLFCAMNMVSCTQESRAPQATVSIPQTQTLKESKLVYLAVDNVSVSSFDTTADWAPPPDAKAPIDGSLLSRWSSAYTDNQWISLDFGKPKTLSKIVIFWEAAYAVDYDILVSEDNQKWQTVASLKEQKGDTPEIEFAPIKARFVKLICLKRSNPQWGISLWEFLCLGPAKDNPEDKPLAEAYPKLAAQLEKKPQTEAIVEEPAVASPGALTLEEFQEGVVYTSWGKTELGLEASDKTLEYLKNLGINHISIMVVLTQETIEEKVINIDPKDTPEDKAIGHCIDKAHSLGMKVLLKTHVDTKTGEWRGNIIPSTEWFASYKEHMLYYARLASKYNVEAFAIGTELANTTTVAWQKEWESIIEGVKQVFTGRLVYCANWDEYKDVGFWDKLDFVGIDAYFPLTTKKDPTKDELINAWKAHANGIDAWLKENKIHKPVIFTEVGYSSADGTNIEPWASFTDTAKNSIDQQEQVDCLEAMLVVSSGYPWFKGFYWWSYFPQERWSPLGYTIRGKKTEEVLSDWLKKIP